MLRQRSARLRQSSVLELLRCRSQQGPFVRRTQDCCGLLTRRTVDIVCKHPLYADEVLVSAEHLQVEYFDWRERLDSGVLRAHCTILGLECFAILHVACVHPGPAVGGEETMMSRDFQRLVPLEGERDDVVARVTHPASHRAA